MSTKEEFLANMVNMKKDQVKLKQTWVPEIGLLYCTTQFTKIPIRSFVSSQTRDTDQITEYAIQIR